jgi:hypothetical protein
MKPAYRSTADGLAPAWSTPRSRRVSDSDLSASGRLRALHTRLRAWWQSWRTRHDERLQIESLERLGHSMLHDLGVSEELKLRALALRESQYERLERSLTDIGGFAGRFGPW